MEFYLSYEGPLFEGKKGKITELKHEIRQRIHSQLSELWANAPELREIASDHREKLARRFSVGDFRFVPLITDDLKLVCHLDTLFLRRENPGALIRKPKDEYGGDLDNRIKIFIDALRVPQGPQELPRYVKPQREEKPYFYCLLEDDALITKFQVESAKLLKPMRIVDQLLEKDVQKHVQLVVKVTTRVTALTIANMSFLNG